MADFYSLLEDKISAIHADPSLSRQVVYDLARYALRNKIYGRSPLLTAAQVNQQMIALEAAIAVVEAKLASKDGIPSNQDITSLKKDIQSPKKEIHPLKKDVSPQKDVSPLNPDKPAIKEEVVVPTGPAPASGLHFDPFSPATRRDAHGDLVVLPPRNIRRGRFAHDDFDDFEPSRGSRDLRITPEAVAIIQMLVNERNSRSRRVLSWLDGMLRVGVVAAIVFAGYVIWSGKLADFLPATPPPTPASAEIAKETPPAPAPPAEPAMLQPSVPVPTAYGVYAIHEDRLFGLTRSTVTPVDPRAKHLLQTTEPSRSVFADGRLSFAIYRRDLANAAPVSVPVRIAARISSMLRTGPGGTLIAMRPEVDTWLIYSAGYMFRTEPVPANPEMILIRPDDPDLVLPAGRYVLLMNDEPYEFSVAGEVTDPRSCVEGFPTPHGPVFHVCKTDNKKSG